MLATKELTIKNLIESREGLHLTGYLVNRGHDLGHLKSQLSAVISEASEFLTPVLSAEDKQKFLSPLVQLLANTRALARMKGNIGLFRTRSAFRVLSLPIDVEHSCIVASSFHVKPLLKWIQNDEAFLLLGLNEAGAHLYYGSQTSLLKVDSLPYAEGPPPQQAARRTSRRKWRKSVAQAVAPVHDWIAELTLKGQPRMFVAGERHLAEAFLKESSYRNIVRVPIWSTYQEHLLPTIATVIRKLRKRELSLRLEKAILEFHLAEEMNLARKNVFQIARAAIEGKVRKLIVADGIRIFGKIDPRTGSVAIHPHDMDHEDDDILDDLAQTVLAHGGEVIVASREEIPKGRPLLAILEDDDPVTDSRNIARLENPTWQERSH